jgi:hypothetical protein
MLCDSFLSYWYNLKKCINEDKKGKLRTYFTFKEHFIREKYAFLIQFPKMLIIERSSLVNK